MTKYSIKNICLGVGIGLILSSVANLSAAPQSLTVDEIKREAAKHDLIVMNAKELIKTQPEEVKQNQPQPAPEKQQTPPKEGQMIVIVVESGTTSEEIAELLVSNKLVDSKQSFLKRLTELKKENKLQIGTFKIPSEATVDQIINIITSTPK